MEAYKPYWPETVFFWGAGATASLGVSVTNKIRDKILVLSQIREQDDQSLTYAIKQAFP